MLRGMDYPLIYDDESRSLAQLVGRREFGCIG